MMLFAATHLACAAAFAVFAALVAAGRPSTRTAKQTLLAATMTAVWAGTAAFSGFGVAGVVPLLETLRTLCWLVLVGSVLVPASTGSGLAARGRSWLLLAPVLAVLLVASDVNHLAVAPDRISLTALEILGRIALSVLGLLLVENLYRNSAEETRWNVAPACVGLGGIFLFDLVLYADAVLLRQIDAALLSARAIADTLTVPFLVLAMARNRNWRVDIHVSRKVAFHSTTFVVSGIFLVSVALVGTMFRRYGGNWGAVVQLSLVFASGLGLAMALFSGQVRSRIRKLVSENFYSTRYDYRAEWIKFIDALSTGSGSDIRQRVIRAVADIVDSPAGALWLLDESAYRPAALWNMHLPPDAKEPTGARFIAGFAAGAAIQKLDELRDNPGAPDWLRLSVPYWLAVPLPHQGRLIGFLVLAQPRAPFAVDWEVQQLLGIIGRQAASYLSEEETARELADARLLSDYSKRFAFVVHDLKNLVSQLRLVLSNADRFSGDPAFRQDAFHTIRGSVDRMNRLLQQLKSVPAGMSGDVHADVEQLVRDVVGASRDRGRVITVPVGRLLRAAIEPGALRSVLDHLLTNAIEASGESGIVTVRIDGSPREVTVEVSDQGEGMDASFVRNELFRPFRTTKAAGYGIGAFQARELVRAVGGDIEVTSQPGTGTTMRVVLPAAEEPRPNVVPVA